MHLRAAVCARTPVCCELVHVHMCQHIGLATQACESTVHVQAYVHALCVYMLLVCMWVCVCVFQIHVFLMYVCSFTVCVLKVHVLWVVHGL